MKFGLFYEHQIPQPWSDVTEQKVFNDALDQIELADRLGIDYVWEVEHHFLEEYSHSSAPEVFLAAASQRTKNIRLGHGVMLMPPAYNPPARVAERIATLDLVSRGRVDWGTGESASAMEMGGFGISPDEKSAMWREATEQAANMLAMTPYPGFSGRYFSMPCRNIVPKSVQRPHPPMWVACSRRETIHRAARHGLGALSFAFIEPQDAVKWVREYYEIIKSSECVPIGHSVNANFALVSGMSVHEDEQVALARGLDGFRFFGYSLGHYGLFGEHMPGRSDVWKKFLAAKSELKDNAGRGGIGTPEQVRAHIKAYEDAGVDQIIFVQQSGMNKHEDICESLELFAKRLLPEFKAREEVRQKKKIAELTPYYHAALERKTWMPAISDTDIPVVRAFGLQGANVGTAQVSTFNDRGGAISVPRMDPIVRK
jgi:alkanesulfonate monooxygenase SsuD/methylene tetrahydromethanopterin reductase-like flavin-dependent oxidoreductase (luciferase family)